MSIVGLVISLVALLFLLIGLIPFLGWFNWFTTLPAAVLGAIISGIATGRSKNSIAIAGLVISAAVFCIALVRLFIGGGVL